MARATTFEQLRDETSLGQSTRIPMLDALQKHLGRRVVSYFGSFMHPAGQVSDDDADVLTELLSVTRVPKPVTLIISSAGGSGLGAERIVQACRETSGGDFDVIVPGQAKSAATIVCLGASKIHMTPTAELGPVDPQFLVTVGKSRAYMPAHTIIKSYESLLTSAEKSKGRIEPFMLQLDRYDAREIEEMRREMKLSEKVAQSLLTTGMMKGKSRAAIKKCLKTFTDPDITGSHGRPIFPAMAKSCGLKVETVPLDGAWRSLWEYYWRAIWAVANRYPKLMETPTSSLGLGSLSD